MKKKIIAAFGALSVAGVIGFVTFQSGVVNAEPKLSKEDIRNQVTSQYPGTINELEFEREGKVNIYEVEVALEGKEYDLKIHADTGEVLNLEEKAVSQKVVEENKNVATDQKMEETTVSNSNDDQGKKTAEDVDSNKSVTPNQTVISSAEAKKIALNNFEGTIIELELDNEDSHHIYEIEVVNTNRKANIEIDAYTGKVIVMEIETDDHDDD
ncbi:PepSY domain-containing protein [Metabacillus endolithicus]|uniref:PepSY domain-containing protein n=1 Tax=Metabacillus endolithicus TaxID=1535204 RepID=A0ABW5BRJ7_9BACI|nr:PepSY domain-containing protein [Metabacillus endolithicus]UPG63773.1 PepSY domain-containing protein [Metabacillus endolithicus]